MSDPVTNVEIEDVLASIRKLVSTSDRVEPDRASAPEAGAAENEPAERLVLTPALRVAETDAASEDAAETPAPDDAPLTTDIENTETAGPETVSEPVPLIWRVDDPRAEETAKQGEDPSEDAASQASTSDVAEFRIDAPLPVAERSDAPAEAEALPDPIAELQGDPPLAFRTSMPPAEPEPAPAEAEATEADGEPAVAALQGEDTNSRAVLMATIAELEAAVEDGDTWEPDGSEPEPQVNWDDLTVPPGLADLNAPQEELASEEPDVGLPPQEPILELRSEEPGMEGAPEETDATFEAEESGSEPAFDASDVDLAPEDADVLSEAGPAVETTQLVDDVVEDVGVDDVEDPDRVPPVVGDTDVIDEDALRDLVAEIVREELQGALGERITRNVRKLVRREIYRILSSQEFD